MNSERCERHIHFNNIIITHVMVTYSSAYRLARISKWEQIARDRNRFQQRIRNVEKTLIKVFNPAHRDYVFIQKNIEPVE